MIATQNPVEQAGTFELPEAQLDRFMLCHRLGYPKPEDEKEIFRRNMQLGIHREDRGAIARTEFDLIDREPVGSSEQLVAAIDAVHHVHVSDTFLEHVVSLIDRTRNHSAIELGCSPRAGIALIKSSRARALIHGRNYVIPDDLFALAEDTILHRIRLNYEALADGLNGEQILQGMLRDIGGHNGSPPAP